MVNEDEIRKVVNRLYEAAEDTDYIWVSEDEPEFAVDSVDKYGLINSLVKYITRLLQEQGNG